MSYLHVDAINQQFPADVSPEAMLIATKFAELLASDDQMTRRVSRDRLEKVTHIKKPRLAGYLQELHERELLVMCEAPKSKKIGDKPIEYKLCLPEGFDKKLIDARRGRYYGGMAYIPKYNENFVEIAIAGDRIADINARRVIQHRSSKNENSSLKNENQSSKIAPINKDNRASLSNNNNNVDVAVDGEVEKFLEAAAKATNSAKGSFAGLVKNAAEARIGFDAVRYFQDSIVPSGKAIRSPIGFLRDLIGKAIAAGGVSAMTGEIAAPKVKTDAEKLQEAIIVVFKRYLTQAPFEGLLSKEEKNVFCRSCFEKFRRPDGEQYLECFFEDFLCACRGYEFESSERLLTELNAFLRNFLAEHP